MLTNVLIISGILLSVVFLVWFFISDKHFSKIAVLFMDAAVIILSIGTITAGLFLRNQSLNEDMENEIEGQEEIPVSIEETDGEDPGEDQGTFFPATLEDDKEPGASPSETPLGGDGRQDTENEDQTKNRPTAQPSPTVKDIPEDSEDSRGAEAAENASSQPQPTEEGGVKEQPQMTEGEDKPAPDQPAAEQNAAGTEDGGTVTGQEEGAGEENSQPDGEAQQEQNALGEEAGQPGDGAAPVP